ncbi:hypothetical protein [Vibrio tritonius]|uniref:hypothetical protein n=1 Tax=Vibrio tritonius TaxID=1435069 RepID=UPI00315DD0E9
MNPKIAALCGWLLLLSLAISLYSELLMPIPSYWAGVPIWISSFFFFPYLKGVQKKQIIILVVCGLFGLLYGTMHHLDSRYFLKTLEANQNVVTMLIGVGFLRIFASHGVQTNETLPIGSRSLIKTLLGIHLFGAVLNMSSVIIVGDKLSMKKPLQTPQAVILLRGFAICAFWSPFFAAMGMTLTSAPGSHLSTLIIYGIPVSLVALALTAWEIKLTPLVENIEGYPMGIKSLWMPCLLALIVLGEHQIWPRASVLSLVALTSVTFIALWLITMKRKSGIAMAKHHIEVGVASSAGEVVLFAAAAMLASGVASILASLNVQLAPEHFGALAAFITLVILVGLAMTGMHPVTSVVLAGSVLAPSVTDPNLLGLTLLMGWSLGITFSPFSGVQLSIQSRYKIKAKTLLAHNWRYISAMLAVCATTLWIYTL